MLRENNYRVLPINIRDIPMSSKNIDGLWEDVIINETSIHRETTHQEDNITTMKYSTKHLQRKKKEV